MHALLTSHSGCSCLLPRITLSNEEGVRVERMMPPGPGGPGAGPAGGPSPPERSRGPMNPPPRPPPGRMRKTRTLVVDGC